MQQHDGVALSHLHVRHLAAEDPPPLLLVRKCCRDHVGFSFGALLRLKAAHYHAVANAAVHHSKNCAPMPQLGQTRSFGDVGSMSGLPASGHGWAIYEYTP